MNSIVQSPKAFSKDNFLCLKGYLAACILIHHLCQFTGFLADTSLGYPLLLLGHWAVTVFIFMSGYGLYSSYLAKGDSYIRNFPRYRLLPFYVTYLLLLVIYIIFDLANGSTISMAKLIRSLTYGETVVSFGWYFQLTLLLYILFYVFKILFKNNSAFLTAISSAILIFVAVNFVLITQKNLYEPAVSFFLGILLSREESFIKKVLLKKSGLFAAFSLVLFAGLTVVCTLIVFRYSELMNTNRWFDLAYLVLMILSDLALIFFVLSFTALASKEFPQILNNPCSRFLGTYSLEIYGLQGLFLRLFNPIIPNRVLFAAISVVCILAASIPAHLVITKIKQTIAPAPRTSQP